MLIFPENSDTSFEMFDLTRSVVDRSIVIDQCTLGPYDWQRSLKDK